MPCERRPDLCAFHCSRHTWSISIPWSICSPVSSPSDETATPLSASVFETSFCVGSVFACGFMKTNAWFLSFSADRQSPPAAIAPRTRAARRVDVIILPI